MSKRTPDVLWKALLEEHFDMAVHFFQPDLWASIDWDQPVEFLDKDLETLFPDDAGEAARCDKLAKVILKKDGLDAWVSFHVEVQGYRDAAFAERMFLYFTRIRERFKKRVFSMAVLTDPDKNWRPDTFREAFFGTETVHRFPIYKVLDQSPEVLATSDDLFSIAIETAYHVAKTYRSSDTKKLSAGIMLARRLLQKGHSRPVVENFLRFVRFHFRFREPESERIFDAEIDQLKNIAPAMTLKEIAIEWSREEGIEEGLKKGIEKGIEKGELNKTRQFVRRMLEAGMTDFDQIARLADVAPSFVEDMAEALKNEAFSAE